MWCSSLQYLMTQKKLLMARVVVICLSCCCISKSSSPRSSESRSRIITWRLLSVRGEYFVPKSKIPCKSLGNTFGFTDFEFWLVANTRILFSITPPLQYLISCVGPFAFWQNIHPCSCRHVELLKWPPLYPRERMSTSNWTEKIWLWNYTRQPRFRSFIEGPAIGVIKAQEA